MTDEKLIDALAKIQCAIEGRTHGFSLDEVVAPGIERWTRHRYEAEILLRDIREAGYVFEKAHAPAVGSQFYEGLSAARRTPCIRAVPGSVIPCCGVSSDGEATNHEIRSHDA